jgi:hypothetical protein
MFPHFGGWNMGDLDWGIFWAAVQGVALAAAAGIAGFQIRAIRHDQKGWETLKACEKYDGDPVLHVVLKRLGRARDSGELNENPRKFRIDATILLNYLDGLAIGEAQRLYDGKIVQDHMEPIIREHVKEFLNTSVAPRMELDIDGFPDLDRLVKKWDDAKKKQYRH